MIARYKNENFSSEHSRYQAFFLSIHGGREHSENNGLIDFSLVFHEIFGWEFRYDQYWSRNIHHNPNNLHTNRLHSFFINGLTHDIEPLLRRVKRYCLQVDGVFPCRSATQNDLNTREPQQTQDPINPSSAAAFYNCRWVIFLVIIKYLWHQGCPTPNHREYINFLADRTSHKTIY